MADYDGYDKEKANELKNSNTNEPDVLVYEEQPKVSSTNLINNLITKNMMIADVANSYPDVVPILLDNGLHCIGCGASEFETIEEGFYGHGLDDSEIDKIVEDINNYIKENLNKE
jgi:hydroxylamine reductase